MFPEYSEQIAALRASDRNFSRLYDKHCALDQEVQTLEALRSNSVQMDIERLKKQKLAIKEQIYAILVQAMPTLKLKEHKNYMDAQWRSTVMPASAPLRM